MGKDDNPVGKADQFSDKYMQGGLFNLSSTAKQKIEKKRKRKGLGEQKPKNVYTSTQIFIGWSSAVLTKSLLLPLDRAKNVMQVGHLATYSDMKSISGFSIYKRNILINL